MIFNPTEVVTKFVTNFKENQSPIGNQSPIFDI